MTKDLSKEEVKLPRPPGTEPADNVGQAEKEIPEHIEEEKTGFHFPKLAFLAGIFAVLLLTLGGGYLLFQNNAGKTSISPSPTPVDETANWKTYEGDGFVFRYPPDYKIDINSQYINVYDKVENLGPANLYLSIDYSLKGVLSDFDATVKEWSVRENAEKINLPNGFKLIYSDENGQVYQVDTFLKYNKGAIRAFYRSAPEIPSKIYDKIISTFKFTDSDETANLKTYTDLQNTYAIKYPSDWKLILTESNNIGRNPVDGLKDVTLYGPEGKVEVKWLDQYGGGCSDPFKWEKMTLSNTEFNVCHGVNGEETWNFSGKVVNQKTMIGIWIIAKANQPLSSNREVVLKILSTFKFTQ